jgi:uncharacterized membrane protein YhdT
MIKSPSPMLVAVGMYLPFPTTFAIFIGGLTKYIVDRISEKKVEKDSDRDIVHNTGLLLASGLIAGEALVGILLAAFVGADINLKEIFGLATDFEGFWFLGVAIFIIIGYVLIRYPYRELILSKKKSQ